MKRFLQGFLIQIPGFSKDILNHRFFKGFCKYKYKDFGSKFLDKYKDFEVISYIITMI